MGIEAIDSDPPPTGEGARTDGPRVWSSPSGSPLASQGEIQGKPNAFSRDPTFRRETRKMRQSHAPLHASLAARSSHQGVGLPSPLSL